MKNRNKTENRLFGACSEFSSLTDEAISFAPFQVSPIQVQDHQTMAALVSKVTPHRKAGRGLFVRSVLTANNAISFVDKVTCGASFSLRLLIQSKHYPAYVIIIGSSLSFRGS